MNHSIVLPFLVFVLFIVLGSCKETPKPVTMPLVSTGEISQITSNSATITGEVLSDGNTNIIERGIAIGLNAEPTTSNSRLSAGVGTSTFTTNATGLQAATTYHVRAYAINLVGTAYGMDKTFTTGAVLPTLTTVAVKEITGSTAKSGGQVTNDGGAPVTERGLCWGLNPSPTIANNKTVDGSGVGSFVSTLSGLELTKKYYVRSYATNSAGTAYGNELSFSATTNLIPNNGLIGWWPFNGNANDESGNGNNAFASKVTLTNDRNGNINSAYLFNGGPDEYITTINSFIDFAQDFSTSFWIKAKTDGNSVLLNSTPHTVLGFSLNPYYSGPGYMGFAFGTGLIAGWILDKYSFVNPNPFLDVWVHHAIVKSGLSWKFYQNGTLVHEYNAGAQPTNTLCKLVFGHCDPATCGEGFNGLFDDAALYNRALTSDEILKIYNGTGF